MNMNKEHRDFYKAAFEAAGYTYTDYIDEIQTFDPIGWMPLSDLPPLPERDK
jgi:hypothetical protein